MRLARYVFGLGGVFGFLLLAPMLFLEEQVGVAYPPPVAHPEFFYGFVGVALAWQVAFLLIATDPIRYRPLMLVGVLEKLGYGVPTWVLYAQGRAPVEVVIGGSIDLLLGMLFVASWWATRPRSAEGAAPADRVS